MPLTPAPDDSPAHWIVESLTTFSYDVRGLVPDRFEAYARVFHPAWLGVEDGHDVSWREIAEANGKTPHAGMQFRSITPAGSFDDAGNQKLEQEGLWTSRPSDGDIPRDVAPRLVENLGSCTTASDECYFAYWEGWGDPMPLTRMKPGPFAKLRTPLAQSGTEPMVEPGTPRSARDMAAHFETPGRGYYLYRGHVSEVTTAWDGFGGSLPSIWWPADHAWFVHTEIDLDTTFVGASRDCIDALLADEVLETWEVELSQRITWDSDHINS